jgi:hypothetical protein
MDGARGAPCGAAGLVGAAVTGLAAGRGAGGGVAAAAAAAASSIDGVWSATGGVSTTSTLSRLAKSTAGWI